MTSRAQVNTPKTILITGGCGFIGISLVRAALLAGHTVINLDCLTYAANPQSLKDQSGNPHYHFYKTDIRDRGALTPIFEKHRPDAVIHLAAESHVDRSIDAPDDFIQTNVAGTVNMLEAARRSLQGSPRPFKFIHVSTDEVFGDLTKTGPAFTEQTPYAPSSPYAASKAASDHMALAWHRTHGLPVIVTNCSNNYGPYQFPEKLIPVVILKALRGEPIPIYGDGSNIRDWLYVDDHAHALLDILNKAVAGARYNIGGNNERSNLDLVKTLCALLDAQGVTQNAAELITFVTDRPGHDRRYAINASKIKADIGWEPSVAFDDGFAQTVDWYLDNRDWWEPLIGAGKFGARQGLKS
jgi:dTDP-glucose 4,6-dehydratase